LLISRNYAYMMESYPDSGGIYTYIKNNFGYDHGFIASWFVTLTYLAMFWANVTSLPLFARFFVGDMFRFGRLYSLFGYDVFLGEALLSFCAILVTGYIVMNFEHEAVKANIVLALIFVVGIVTCFAVAMANRDANLFSFEPGFASGSSPISQIMYIAFISPWAFIGFENISQSADEFTFSKKKSFKVLTAAVLSSTALYIMLILFSISAYPANIFGSWPSYIENLGRTSNLDGLPVFFAGNYYLGSTGLFLLSFALFALIVTSLFGNVIALSRLFYSLAKDKVVSKRFAVLNEKRNPSNAVLLAILLSLVIPLLGRTAIGWIVDVTTIGAIIVYGFVSAAAYKSAKAEGRLVERITGFAGFLIMLVSGLMLFFPVLFNNEPMAMESYFLFTVWSILGFFYFRKVLDRDTDKRFGKSIIVWFVLVTLVMFTSLNWLRASDNASFAAAMKTAQRYYNRTADAEDLAREEDAFIEHSIEKVHSETVFHSCVTIGLFMVALILSLYNYSIVRRRLEATEMKLGYTKELAYKDALTGVKSKQAWAEQASGINRLIEADAANDFALLVCDINGLKYINDHFGHNAGDDYICSACRLVCTHYKHSPVYRIGGDEFLVLLEGQSFEEREELLARFNRKMEENLAAGKVVVSAGMALYHPEVDTTVFDVFERADGMMYQRKYELKKMGAAIR
ncbi:MAG: amino acid permease, partial [Acidaminococcaceae bacterium]|nr:amino acid permease [Acidaminococcaceae bacterium]